MPHEIWFCFECMRVVYRMQHKYSNDRDLNGEREKNDMCCASIIFFNNLQQQKSGQFDFDFDFDYFVNDRRLVCI